MSFDDYNTLEKIVRQMHRELGDLEDKIKYNLQCIKEAEVYAGLLLGSDPDNYKIFSPRNAENVHKDELAKAYKEKEDCEKKNEQLYAKRNMLQEQIKGLENILDHKEDGLAVLNIQEEDRQRIARDLHDTSLQNLAHLIHKIELSSLYIDEDAIKAKLELSVVNNVLRKTIDEIRNTIFDLRPMTFDDLGLKASLERLLSNFNESQKYFIETDIDDVSCENNLVLVSLYRVIQECLNNIEKHADAEKIVFSCKSSDGKCMVLIQDDGKGFDRSKSPEGKHFGLSLMKERIDLINGKFQISSEEKKGTSIQIEVPL
ncbi:MAG: sensor histidine kinase [Butyrivibrio sp.]|nr:sensor histidine kinase [Acetatifactor muris]MCM1559783.1 sensor histidine kinase [Butyrivibrio sp.]